MKLDGPARVLVGRSSSQCSACGGNASPHDTAHIHGGPSPSGYQDGSDLSSTNGCKAVWVRREPMYLPADADYNWTDMSRPLFPALDGQA